jgi:glycine/D-amino acid oxidase-like deaminating enzyme
MTEGLSMAIDIHDCDKIVIGAGIYGMYAAVALARQGCRVVVLDADRGPFTRGSYINQARVHNGYHYPRSFSTAKKSAKYFQRFADDFSDCILLDFEQIYAISAHYSWTNGEQFARFCKNVGIRCDEISDVSPYFNPHTIEKAFITHEYTFDPKLIGGRLHDEALSLGVKFAFNSEITSIENDSKYKIITADGSQFVSGWVLNATYAGINEIHQMAGFGFLDIKYELCEVILVSVSDNIAKAGLTVMDGPFFSVMPFGKTGYHSLTTVSKTPHMTSYDRFPTFPCQSKRADCSPNHMRNCNDCPNHPESAFVEMYQTARKYMNPGIKIEYVKSFFALKPILKASEMDDSRPTLVRQYSENPYFYSVLSGKINTIYDLDEILK